MEKSDIMSEKRFELVEAIYNEIGKQQIEIMDNLEKQIVDRQKIADLLNHLSKENEELKQQLDKIPPQIKEIWLNG